MSDFISITPSAAMRAVVSAALDEPIPADVAAELGLPSTDPLYYREASTMKTLLNGSGGAVALRDARSLIFGELVKLSAPVLEHYHGDLYHDAVWIMENIDTDAVTFYYAFNKTGTTIGTDRDYVAYSSRKHMYVITVACVDGRVTIDVVGE
jgi:hypothetical protein